MKTVKNIAVAAFLIGMVAVFVGASAAVVSDDVKFTDAASYYKAVKCETCHGKKAEKKFDTTKTDDQLVEIILKGKKPEKPPNMPGYEAKGITADQAKELLAYMKSLKV